MTTDPPIDHRARRAAKRVGLVARKSRRRAGTVDNHGGFQLIEPLTNAVVRGERFDMSAEDVLEFCKARDMGDAPVNNLDFTKDLSDFLRQALTECEAKGMKLLNAYRAQLNVYRKNTEAARALLVLMTAGRVIELV